MGNPKVTILKIDIEGYEGKVLSVFNKFDTIKQIVIETHSKKLTERKRKAMSMRAKNPRRFKDIEEVEKIFMKKRDQHKTDQLFSKK